MRLIRSTCAFLALFSPVLLPAAITSSPASVSEVSAPSDPGQLAASFSVTSPTSVPGKVLKPGSYTIRVVDHLSDRIVLRIEDPEGKPSTTFLGLPSSGLGSSGTGPVSWPGSPKGSTALRGFAFAGGNAVEFVYPKDEAVAIAKVNTSKVAAIDPPSDNLPARKDLSREDMQMVTLWSLSATRVGPNDSTPAIQAEHYKVPETVLAQSTPAPEASPAYSSPDRSNAQSSARSSASSAPRSAAPVRAAHAAAPQQVATMHRPAVVRSLPHTASNLPALMLLTLMSLLGTAVLRLARFVRAAR